MRIQSDIVIAGAGVIGASVAYHLARRGCDGIVVIDRGEDFGAGSTLKATGGFRAQFDNETEVRLSLLAREKLRAFEDEIGVDSGYRPYGYLFLACNDAELDELRRAQRVQHACGLHEAQMVSAEEARAINPMIGDASVIGGAFCPTDGFIRAKNILHGYADAAKRLGVRFQFGTELRDWSDVDARVKIECRGAWSGAPVVPLRRNVAATVPTNVLPETMPMTIWSGDWYHVRVRDGRVLILWPDDPPNDANWLRELMRRTEERMPCLSGVPLEEFWWGFYEMTPDERALLGEWNGIYYAAGASGHGVMHSPALGHLLAELIVDGRTSIDIGALRPDRFGVRQR
jgi:sarcosine oxidase subunit beta